MLAHLKTIENISPQATAFICMLRKFRNVKSISYLWKVEENFETFCQDQLANLDRCCPDVSGVEVMEENLRELENQVAFILLQMPKNYQGRWRELWYIAWAVCLQICHAKEAGCPQGFKLPQQSFFLSFSSFISRRIVCLHVNIMKCMTYPSICLNVLIGLPELKTVSSSHVWEVHIRLNSSPLVWQLTNSPGNLFIITSFYFSFIPLGVSTELQKTCSLPFRWKELHPWAWFYKRGNSSTL